MRTVAAYTLGCKVNQYDTDGVLSLFAKRGFTVVPFTEKADVYIINTCTVTAESDKKSRQMVRRAREKNLDGIVCVMGCYTQTASEAVKEIGADIIVGTAGRDKIVDLVEAFARDKKQQVLVTEPDAFEDLPVTYHEKTRVYIKIEDGCENFCAYCKIPYSRGRIRSRRPESVIEEVTRLRDSGVREVVFTGIHVGFYGKDLPGWNLARILRESLEIPGIRIRLSSLDPHEVDDEIIELLEHPRFCRHLHIPLQSGNDKILKKMNRNYDTAYYRSIISRLKDYAPLGITTDVIVGFPSETEEDFRKTYEFVEEMGFTRLHVFPFSHRENTPAYYMPLQVPQKEKARRVKELIDLGASMMQSYHERQIGRTAEVVVEQETTLNGKRYFVGTSDDYIRVYIAEPCTGLAKVKLDQTLPEGSGMLGTLLETV
ncbi:MAG TPA: tRNA (N(6)-L-threonylcarbamoyladenosine(37)-C(2))-methylthiotransferase MtaB [Bacillota bacterium]|nr:tRNA (N(6)-L-threonylcarbamoyladenosine(37)-C(2))-methylthiotransferase MtaB [Bacillota bacterium]HPZ72951.1 tRNA (N(6)-L-threonylcarbamoyladenosine(37)-C(2))-methylthiotransferase MtaB [Bacillota bacterium]HQD77780.1 tRNA (N(6)-L-threonylcarbamoyladenosine(37)-C(2))-methylthiotransferase MtaB [Bacillota bacterium]